MQNDTIEICFEQKLLALQKIHMLTEELIDLCNDEKLDEMNALFLQRQDCINRIEKCRILIDSTLAEYPEADQKTVAAISDETISHEKCPPQWRNVYDSQVCFITTLRETVNLDHILVQQLTEKRESLISNKPNQSNKKQNNYR